MTTGPIVERRALMQCHCLDAHGEPRAYHATCSLDPYSDAVDQRLLAKMERGLLDTIRRDGGPWGWTFGPLRVVVDPVQARSDAPIGRE